MEESTELNQILKGHLVFSLSQRENYRMAFFNSFAVMMMRVLQLEQTEKVDKDSYQALT